MPGILTRRIGPFPGWVWGVAAGGAFLLFLYMRRRGQTQGQPQGSLVNNPAASAIPYVPSVTVTGIPQPGGQPGGTPSGGQTLTVRQSQAQVPGSPVQNYDSTHFGVPVRQTPGGFPIGQLPFGSQVNTLGAPVSGPDNLNAPADASSGGTGPGAGVKGSTLWWPVSYLGLTAYLSAYDVGGPAASGAGGWGYAGAGSLGAPIGGWTVGWQPFGAGAGPTVNRTGTARRSRRLYGGSGGGTAVNRTGARATRPLRARDLRGR